MSELRFPAQPMDPSSDILLVRGRYASWENQHVLQSQISTGEKTAPVS